MRLESIVAGYAGVEFPAAFVFDGDDVKIRAPVAALCGRRHVNTMHPRASGSVEV
jgi:hypothetical protein